MSSEPMTSIARTDNDDHTGDDVLTTAQKFSHLSTQDSVDSTTSSDSRHEVWSL